MFNINAKTAPVSRCGMMKLNCGGREAVRILSYSVKRVAEIRRIEPKSIAASIRFVLDLNGFCLLNAPYTQMVSRIVQMGSEKSRPRIGNTG